LTIALACLLAGSALAVNPLFDLTLEWRPTNKVSKKDKVDLAGLAGIAIKVQPLVDRRHVPNPQRIGENRENEKKGEVLEVLTKDDVAAFCTTNFAATLKHLGLPVNATGATVTISGELTSFFVTEKDGYTGDVSLSLKVTNARGEVLWSGVAKGAAKHGGRSYNASNYFETLSNSLQEAVLGLVKDRGFLDALAGKPTVK
jgi:hypothetical protein